jgi:hypothetical protein
MSRLDDVRSQLSVIDRQLLGLQSDRSATKRVESRAAIDRQIKELQAEQRSLQIERDRLER